MELKKYEVKITPITKSMMTYPPRGIRDSASQPPSPADTSNELTELIFQEIPEIMECLMHPFIKKVCQIIFYKCIIQEKGSISIFNLF